MSKSLRILHLEDSAADVERMKAELMRAGTKILSERVSSADRFTSALREFQPDVVLCDHAHAALDARAALAAVQAHRPSAPLILVSSALDEQTAVTSVRAGAEDIVLKRLALRRHRPHHSRDRPPAEAQRQDGRVSSRRGDEAPRHA